MRKTLIALATASSLLAGIPRALPALAQPLAAGPGATITAIPGTLSAVSANSASSAWAAGQTTTATTKTLILHWNGTSWAQVPSPSPGAFGSRLLGVDAVSAASAWAVGDASTSSGGKALIVHWNGTKWALTPNPAPGISELTGVSAASATSAWAVGGYALTPMGANKTLVLHWDGIRWAQLPSPSPGPKNELLEAVSVVSARNAWAVGWYFTSTGVGKTLVLHWDGVRWAQLPSPSPGPLAQLFGVSRVSASSAWAVGQYLTSTGVPQTLVLHWNGTRWARVASPNPGAVHGSTLAGVSARTGSDAWASGSYGTAAGGNKTLLLHWNGTRWAQVPSPSPGSQFAGSVLGGVSAVSAADAWAAGTSFPIGSERTLLLHWNGMSWTRS